MIKIRFLLQSELSCNSIKRRFKVFFFCQHQLWWKTSCVKENCFYMFSCTACATLSRSMHKKHNSCYRLADLRIFKSYYGLIMSQKLTVCSPGVIIWLLHMKCCFSDSLHIRASLLKVWALNVPDWLGRKNSQRVCFHFIFFTIMHKDFQRKWRMLD